MRTFKSIWASLLVLSVLVFIVSAYGPTPTADLARRQDREDDGGEESSTISRRPTATRDSDDDEDTATITPPPKTTGRRGGDDDDNEDDKEDGTTTSRRRTTRIPANAPAGGVDMKSPSVFDGMQYYKINGDPITWSYNFTSLVVTPTAINVEAFCSKTQQYYSIAHNYSSSETTVTWDTDKFQSTATNQLVMETYTLFMYDAAASRTDIPKPGHLGVFNRLQFALYNPTPYVHLKEWECPTCSDASSTTLDHGVKILLGTALLTVLSFTWFIRGMF